MNNIFKILEHVTPIQHLEKYRYSIEIFPYKRKDLKKHEILKMNRTIQGYTMKRYD